MRPTKPTASHCTAGVTSARRMVPFALSLVSGFRAPPDCAARLTARSLCPRSTGEVMSFASHGAASRSAAVIVGQAVVRSRRQGCLLGYPAFAATRGLQVTKGLHSEGSITTTRTAGSRLLAREQDVNARGRATDELIGGWLALARC